jgi:hypothetical protein
MSTGPWPAQLHRRPLGAVRRELHQMLADRDRAGEADLADDRRSDQVARDHIRHAKTSEATSFGKSGVQQAFEYLDRRSGRFLSQAS